jgi:hypothetical protein
VLAHLVDSETGVNEGIESLRINIKNEAEVDLVLSKLKALTVLNGHEVDRDEEEDEEEEAAPENQ